MLVILNSPRTVNLLPLGRGREKKEEFDAPFHPSGVMTFPKSEFWNTTRAKMPHGRPMNVVPMAVGAPPCPTITLLRHVSYVAHAVLVEKMLRTLFHTRNTRPWYRACDPVP